MRRPLITVMVTLTDLVRGPDAKYLAVNRNALSKRNGCVRLDRELRISHLSQPYFSHRTVLRFLFQVTSRGVEHFFFPALLTLSSTAQIRKNFYSMCSGMYGEQVD